jgi:hypothetical protein
VTVEYRENTDGRDARGRFGPGNTGRPRGSRNRINKQVLDALGDLSSQAVMVLRENLTQNNLKAAIYVLDRFLPSERSIEIQSTDPQAWSDALADGDLTPGEAAKAAQAMKVLADAAEVREIKAKLDELEAMFAALRDRR